MPSTEKETQKAVLDYLSLKGIFHYRQNSGAFKTDRGGFYRMGASGAPDIVAVVNICYIGVYVALEIKDIHGKLNDNQIKFKEDLEKSGGFYFIIRSLEDCINALDNVKRETMQNMRSFNEGKT